MHPNAELLNRFYTALAARDAVIMAECYAEDAAFSDPVFRDLRGEEIGRMWRMLCGRAKDLQVEFSGIEADDNGGQAHWVARYSFSGTNRPVVNSIHSRFGFRQGKIALQADDFDLYRWSRQALGLKGALFGWFPPFRALLRRQALGRLRTFQG